MKYFERKFKNGFTLIELLVVIAIVGILAAGAIILINPTSLLQKAHDTERKSDLKQVQNGLELYYSDKQHYPETLNFGESWGEYMPEIPEDPEYPSSKYAYFSDGGQTYYLFASLERGGSDPQACDEGNACAAIVNYPNACGDICNYGVSSSNVTVSSPAVVYVPKPLQTPLRTYYVQGISCNAVNWGGGIGFGYKFKVSNPGKITALWGYYGMQNEPITFRLWKTDSPTQPLAELQNVTGGAEEWIGGDLSSQVNLEANTSYTVGIYSPGGHYCVVDYDYGALDDVVIITEPFNSVSRFIFDDSGMPQIPTHESKFYGIVDFTFRPD